MTLLSGCHGSFKVCLQITQPQTYCLPSTNNIYSQAGNPDGGGRVKKHNGSQWCGAMNCSANKAANPDISFHRFPKDPERQAHYLIYCIEF